MKFLIGILLVMTCTYISFRLSDKYTIRKNFFNTFLQFTKILKNEVSFSKRTILSLLKDKQCDKDLFYSVVTNYFNNKDFTFDNKHFSNDEKEHLKSFLEEIGKTNSGLQYEFLSTTEKTIGEKLAVLQEEEKKYKNLYLKLGFLLGILLFVLII